MNTTQAKQQALLPNEEDQYWQDYLQEHQAKEGERLEDAAKFLSGMISISLTIFLKLNGNPAATLMGDSLAIAVVVLWLISLVAAFFVLFPFKYRHRKGVTKTIREMHHRMVRNKRWSLMVSALCFFLPLFLMGVGFVVGVLSL